MRNTTRDVAVALGVEPDGSALSWLADPIAPPTNGAPGQRRSLVEVSGNELTMLLLVSPARRSVDIPPEAIQAAFGLS